MVRPPPDCSPQICDEYAQKDNRIKVIHKKNGGLSSARNTGLDIAKGDYIYFVDSDDYIHKDLIKDNVRLLSNHNADMVCFNYSTAELSGKFIEHIEVKDNYSSEYLREQFFHGNFIVSANTKLYKSSVWKNLRFPLGMKFEDTYILPDVLLKADNIIPNEKVYYIYNRTNISSITRSTDSISRHLFMLDVEFHRLDIAKQYYNTYFQQCLENTVKRCLKMYIFNCYKNIAKNHKASQWKRFILKNYKYCNTLCLKDYIYIFSMKLLNIINYIKGMEYYLKYKKRGDF